MGFDDNKFSVKHRVSKDSNGLAVIEEMGLCFGEDVAEVEQDVTSRYRMVTIPNVEGAVMKTYDGTTPTTSSIQPSTFDDRSYECVKVFAQCNPYAYQQPAGPFVGKTILSYIIRWQEVGSVA